ncbi:MAG: hypothetical protein MK185_07320 [Saccharospirillaceae bacterium]|jgi:hypothetical protein|nr:hypothetical protein A3759_15000 [Thalassolituus sp. HI0120]MCH2040425.1 hypothetical protein [Saccharospirillaceae bacterium]
MFENRFKCLPFTCLLLLPLSMLSGCGDSDNTESSSDFATSGISAYYEVEAKENAAREGYEYRLQARFRHGDDILKLDGGDQVSVSGPGEYSLAETAVFGDVIYNLTVDIEDPLRTSFTFKLERNSQQDADQSSVTVPRAFEANEPVAGAVVELSSSKLLTVRWSNNDDDSEGMTVTQDYRCFTSAQGEVLRREESNTFSEAGGETSGVIDVAEATLNGSYAYCTVDLTFSRARQGILDPELKSGATNGYFVDSVTDVRINF